MPRFPKTRPAKSTASASARRLALTADELEAKIAERAGVSPSQVAVRGNPPDWEAIALPKSVERAARINTAAWELKEQYALKE
jgi:hypothetical protein